MRTTIELSLFPPRPRVGDFSAAERGAAMEFHVSRSAREEYGFNQALFSLRGNVVFADFRAARDFTQRMNAKVNPLVHPELYVKAGQVNAMGLIDEILHFVVALYREQVAPGLFRDALADLENALGRDQIDALLRSFVARFPPLAVYRGELDAEEYLAGTEAGEKRREMALEELLMLRIANLNPAFGPFKALFDEAELAANTVYEAACARLMEHLGTKPHFGPDDQNLWDLLRSPAIAEPRSLTGQLEYIRRRWGLVLGDFLRRILGSLDLVKEEEKPIFFGSGPTQAYVYDELQHDYERFTEDKDWMPRVVLMAKTVLVWLSQLSLKYGRTIDRLDLIPDEELDELALRGFTGLWLIGLWERSEASREIKRRMGNPEAAASAYSLYDYDIASELGGWWSLDNLRERCARRGIRLGSDMVPNHTGIDSRWVMEHPDRFLQLRYPPFPTYTFTGDNLSNRHGVGVYLEDHYWNRSDAAVVFKRVDFNTGETRYIYHGNDGTSMPWNDTAQIDFLNPEAREAVIRTIVGVCKQFPIVRFDAAMTLAKKHIQRLWYPEPGRGGDIASRAEHALTREEFEARIPNEFWREVVDRCAEEAPDTLLLAEAFWMMEGYFVRTLGMHRVYNSAFMNMLKNEENPKYRSTIKNTMEFDPEILKRFVNFMNNPDEETAVAQFGRGDKYFGVCTLMATMPGLPMFGHGQIEGFEEKYGMEYRRAYRDERPDDALVDRHNREIFPLLKKRRLFSGSEHFALYDLVDAQGQVQENVFAYSNRIGEDRALVLYNNAFQRAAGWIAHAAPSMRRTPEGSRLRQGWTLAQALGFSGGPDRFVFLREQRSNLWFIRSSAEIAERGIFASLDGYQCQVFLDLHEIADDAFGRWRRLHDELGGRGVPDLQAALQDLFLRDLYDAFNAVVSDRFLDSLRTTRPAKKPAAKKKTAGQAGEGIAEQTPFSVEELQKPVLHFCAVASDYLDGASGRYEAFSGPAERVSRCDEVTWEVFQNMAARLRLVLDHAAEKAKTEGTRGTPGYLDSRAALYAPGTVGAEYLAGYLCLALLRGVLGADTVGEDAVRLIDHWCLDRKLRERLQVRGADGKEAYHTIALLKLILARTGAPPSEPAARTSVGGGDLLGRGKIWAREAFEDPGARGFLGVNLFEGVQWFNKERFEEALLYSSLVAVLEGAGSLPSGETPIAGVEAVAAEIDRAKVASGYRVDQFLAELEDQAPPVRAKGPAQAKGQKTTAKASSQKAGGRDES